MLSTGISHPCHVCSYTPCIKTRVGQQLCTLPFYKQTDNICSKRFYLNIPFFCEHDVTTWHCVIIACFYGQIEEEGGLDMTCMRHGIWAVCVFHYLVIL